MPVASRYRVPRWVAVGVLLVLGGGAAFCTVFYWPWLTRPRVEAPRHALPDAIECGSEPSAGWRDFEERFIGHKEEDIAARFGPPAAQFGGHYGCPPLDEARRYPEAHTRVYAGKSGQLYMSFCKQRGRWVCFTASWLPEGWAF